MISLEQDSHSDEARFWRDFSVVLSLRSTDKQGAFCLGLVTAATSYMKRFPTREVMEMAVSQDARVFWTNVQRRRDEAEREGLAPELTPPVEAKAPGTAE